MKKYILLLFYITCCYGGDIIKDMTFSNGYKITTVYDAMNLDSVEKTNDYCKDSCTLGCTYLKFDLQRHVNVTIMQATSVSFTIYSCSIGTGPVDSKNLVYKKDSAIRIIGDKSDFN